MQRTSLENPVIKKGDMVQVIAGKEKGKTGKVLSVARDSGRISVERLNMVKRHTKPSQKSPQGGIVEKESPLNYSNVLLFCAKCNKGVRVTRKIENDKKTRDCKKCGSQL